MGEPYRRIVRKFAVSLRFIFVVSLITHSFLGFAFSEPPSCITKLGARSAEGKAYLPKMSKDHFRIMTYNLRDFFSEVKTHNLKVKLKEERQILEIAKVFRDADADVVVVQEVESLRQLRDFASKYLGSQYQAYLVSGNDERNIGFFVKNSLNLQAKITSYQNVKWFYPAFQKEILLFPRDLPVLTLSDPSSSTPNMVILGVHALADKDRGLGPDKKPLDPGGEQRRSAEFGKIAEVVDVLDQKYKGRVPIFVAGDFNSDFYKSRLIQILRKSLVNPLDGVGFDLPSPQTYSHFYGPRGTTERPNPPVEKKLLDMIWTNPLMQGHVKRGFVYQYYREDGELIPEPQSGEEIERLLPSDHLPVVFDFDLKSI